MSLPPGYELRAPEAADVDAVAAVLEADAGGDAALDADFLRESWSRAGFDLATDAWVVLDDAGETVAYAETMLEEPGLVEAWGVVHPAQRGRGIGTALLDLTEDRASELLRDAEGARLRHAVNSGDRAAAAMLERRGFGLVRHFWHMEIDPVDAPASEPAPEGVAITGVAGEADVRAVHAVMEEAFAEDWDYRPQQLDEWLDEHRRSPSYDGGLWLLARDGGRPVGALTATAGRDRGWITELGVAAAHRGRGVGSALLRRAFAAFATRGLRRVILNVDAQNPTGATELYERAGMRVVGRWDLWER
ncbi:MAG TPA: GNAT family N-acetyltransferase [Actinomycetota bacterium]|nr:GNAT family N-acetyltransferase [Actinomycetota bacterium]